jgi:hypothetical protein
MPLTSYKLLTFLFYSYIIIRVYATLLEHVAREALQGDCVTIDLQEKALLY